MQASIKSGGVQPAKVNDPSFTSTRRLNPSECFGASAAVVGGKNHIPSRKNDERANYVDEKKASHRRTALTPLMPMVRPRLRLGQGGILGQKVIFFDPEQRRLWKIENELLSPLFLREFGGALGNQREPWNRAATANLLQCHGGLRRS